MDIKNLVVGMRVYVCSLNKKGIISSIDLDEVKVLLDGKVTPTYVLNTDLVQDSPEAMNEYQNKIKAVQQKIVEAGDSLENAFKSWREACALYGEEAGPLDLKEDYNLDISSFVRAINRNGWSSSSLFC